MSMQQTEVLAPAGDRAAMEAAVKAGADAVYFGLQGFNARARATNFDDAQLGETMAFLHHHGVRGHVALNTLIFDSELGAAEAAIRACAAAGVDAVIIQDLGLLALARAVAPGLEIHASTQMTCTDAASVRLAGELGASRVILARELSLGEIEAICGEVEGVEVEVFVHGALCVAYSGQCLTSEAIGGRSANRGACAQACRLPYDLEVDGQIVPLGDRAYLLSPQDLEASDLVPRLLALGVRSLKIEGRLKGPAYVAATTALYREAVDRAAAGEAAPLDESRRRALQLFSRGSGPGFLAGVDHQRLVEGVGCDHRGLEAGRCLGVRGWKGKEVLRLRSLAPIARGDGLLVEGGKAGEGEVGGRVWALWQGGVEVERVAAGVEIDAWLGPDHPVGRAAAGHRVWKTSDPAAESEALGRIDRAPRRLPIDLRVSGHQGGTLVIEGVTARGVQARVEGDAPIGRAERSPIDEALLRDKLGRLGDSPFELRALVVDLPPDAIVPVSSLNRARRALVDALVAGSARSIPTASVSAADLVARAAPPEGRAPLPPGLFVLCRDLDQAHAAVDAGASGVYLDFLELTGTGAAVRALRERGPVHITLAPPRVRKPGEDKIDRYLLSLAPDALLVRGVGALGESGELPRIGDFSLNVTNRLSAALALGRGLGAFTPSFDLDAGQLVALLGGGLGPWAEVVLHHPMPLFHMEHCVYAALLSEGRDHRTCGRPCDRHKISLRDRAGMSHPVEADVGCRNTVFHAHPQSAAQFAPVLQKAGVGRFRIELVREKPAEVGRLVETYHRLLRGEIGAAQAWRQLRVEGGYGVGVVRGSLRVIEAGR
jgi:putative protease